MDTRDIKNVLVIKLRHIGDVLMCAPVFAALKRHIPGVRTCALVPAGTEEMLTLNPDVDEVLTVRKGGPAESLRLVRTLRSRRFDAAINMTEGDRGAILALMSGARFRVGVEPDGRGFIGKRLLFHALVKTVYDGRSRAAMDLDMLSPLGIRDTEPRLAIYTSVSDDDYVRDLLNLNDITPSRPYAVVHPTSRWLFKCWRDEAVAEVVDYLEGRGIRVVVTSGPDESELDRLKGILSKVRSRPLVLAGELTLKQLAALLRESILFFGVDSAPMHIAAAVGTKVVALFGPSDHRVWGPLTAQARVLAKEGEFGCIPCNRDGCEGTKRSACLEAITVGEAVAAVESLIGAPARDEEKALKA